MTRRPTRPFWSIFQLKPSAWFTKQSDFHQKTASKLASLDVAIYPGQAPSCSHKAVRETFLILRCFRWKVWAFHLVENNMWEPPEIDDLGEICRVSDLLRQRCLISAEIYASIPPFCCFGWSIYGLFHSSCRKVSESIPVSGKLQSDAACGGTSRITY